MEEGFLTINGQRHDLWRAVDQDDHVLDILVPRRRNVRGRCFMASPDGHKLTFLRGSGFLLSLVGVWDLMADASSQWPAQKGEDHCRD
jgi:hypothetical protein